MNAYEATSKILLYTDNTLATDAGTAKRRVKILEWMQEIFDEVWNWADWDWTYKAGSIIVPTAGYVALPSDFVRFGSKGRAYDSNGRPLDEVNPQQILEQHLSSGQVSTIREFAVYIADDGVMRLYTPKPGSALTLTIYYKFKPPTLVDINHATSSNLQHIPSEYHYSVILAGLKERAARSKGDARAGADWATLYRQGLSAMVKQAQPKRSTTQVLPKGYWGGF